MQQVRAFALDIRALMGAELAPGHLERVPLRYCLLADRRRGDDGLLALATGILLSECAGITEDASLIFDAQGKPYALGKDCKISIAHAGYLAVVALSDELVGIDVEPIPSYTDQAHVRALEGIYGKGNIERKAVLSTKSGPETFCELWTRAEATCKRDGLDLGSALREDPDYLTGTHAVSVPCKGHMVSCAALDEPEMTLELFDAASWLERF